LYKFLQKKEIPQIYYIELTNTINDSQGIYLFNYTILKNIQKGEYIFSFWGK